ncbi:ATP-binding protein [Streptomyces sp. V2]|uniref:ATP-binding protein n=1 Tax=Streptomyces niveiscabiei TaxID=164115 RepID=A0ABW9I7E3_9ACTN|nr:MULTISPECIES: ATP-binding protein [Streptomyces]PWG12358.1 ATP-binding protein [Streptomyces sp. V2]
MNKHFPPFLVGPLFPTYCLILRVGDHSPRHIRRITRTLLKEWRTEEVTHAVELALTELVTNVHRHVPDRRCQVLILRQPNAIRVEVTDPSPQLPAPIRDLPLDAESGRGLVLVDALTDKWGIDPVGLLGKTVWFECATPMDLDNMP